MARTTASLLNTNLSTKGPDQIKEFIVLKVPSIFWDLAWVVPLPSNSTKMYKGLCWDPQTEQHVVSCVILVVIRVFSRILGREATQDSQTNKHPPSEDASPIKKWWCSIVILVFKCANVQISHYLHGFCTSQVCS